MEKQEIKIGDRVTINDVFSKIYGAKIIALIKGQKAHVKYKSAAHGTVMRWVDGGAISKGRN